MLSYLERYNFNHLGLHGEHLGLTLFGPNLVKCPSVARIEAGYPYYLRGGEQSLENKHTVGWTLRGYSRQPQKREILQPGLWTTNYSFLRSFPFRTNIHKAGLSRVTMESATCARERYQSVEAEGPILTRRKEK